MMFARWCVGEAVNEEGGLGMLAPFDMLTRRRARAPIVEGATYRRTAPNGFVETARVMSVDHDVQGIQHVRFHMYIARGDIPFVDEERMLNAETFIQRFGNPVES